MTEIWKDIEGYVGFYQVSNMGRVKSLDRVIFRLSPAGKRQKITRKGQIKKQSMTRYPRVSFCVKGASKSYSVHRLVLIAFKGSDLVKKIANHKDGVITNNFLSNLEWVTSSENNHHALKNGLSKGIGETHYKALLKNKDVITIKKMLKKGIMATKIAKKYGVNKSVINSINTGRSWRSVK